MYKIFQFFLLTCKLRQKYRSVLEKLFTQEHRLGTVLKILFNRLIYLLTSFSRNQTRKFLRQVKLEQIHFSCQFFSVKSKFLDMRQIFTSDWVSQKNLERW